MTEAQRTDGFVLTPAGFIRGVLEHQGGRITRIEGEAVTEYEVRHGSQDLPLILPGFIDVHVHGGGGRDTMEGGDAARQIARLHVRHGTTSLLAASRSTTAAAKRQAAWAGAGIRTKAPFMRSKSE